MAAAGNTVTVTGNVTRDPELRFTDSGTAVANFGIAWNKGIPPKRDGDEWDNEAHFFDVTVWQQLAENVAETLRKGDRVTVTGRLDFHSWEDKETGNNRSKVEIVADDVSISLRFAVVREIEKNERKGDGGGGRGGGRGRGRGDDDGGRGGRGSGRGRGRSSGRGRDSGGADSYDDDDEPF